jgi:hypothetical protein
MFMFPVFFLFEPIRPEMSKGLVSSLGRYFIFGVYSCVIFMFVYLCSVVRDKESIHFCVFDIFIHTLEGVHIFILD